MNRSIEDLLTWGEYCGAKYKNTDIICLRNEHQEDTPHQNEDLRWW